MPKFRPGDWNVNPEITASMLLRLLAGATYANAFRRNGKPCPFRLPEQPEARREIVEAHIRGTPATVTFCAQGFEPWSERVEAVALSVFCPGCDQRCRWVAVDLDADDHGPRGLVDPIRAARVLAERAGEAGLLSGLLVARSRRGRGRHFFLVLPEPIPLADAVIGLAALVGSAYRIAARDVAEAASKHVFRRVDGEIARPGDDASLELLPRSTGAPSFGWSLALPAGGVAARLGGGVVVDPFEDRPAPLERIPSCDPESWSNFVAEARSSLGRQCELHGPSIERDCRGPAAAGFSFEHLDVRTRAFLSGNIPEGARNCAAFAASANLLGCGADERDAERLILGGAETCGLPRREAVSAFRSALKTIRRKQGLA